MRTNTHHGFCALISALLTLVGCVSHRIRTPAPPAALAVNASYLDLRPGWRLRVVTPLLKSGGYRLTSKIQQTGTNTMTITASEDFIGYETAYYLVRTRWRAGLDIQFLSAEATRDGVTKTQPRPTLSLFQLPPRRRYVRLIYLRRVSQSDHDMAVLAASSATVLAKATKQVQRDAAACHDTETFSCSWVPAGIAVIAERRQKHVNGAGGWISAR